MDILAMLLSKISRIALSACLVSLFLISATFLYGEVCVGLGDSAVKTYLQDMQIKHDILISIREDAINIERLLIRKLGFFNPTRIFPADTGISRGMNLTAEDIGSLAPQITRLSFVSTNMCGTLSPENATSRLLHDKNDRSND